MKRLVVVSAVFAVLVMLKLAGCKTVPVVPDVEPSPSPSVQPSPAPSGAKLRLPKLSTYLTYYGDWTTSAITGAQKFPLIIAKQGTTAEVIRQLKANGAIVVSYVSVGEEVQDKRDKGDGLGPVKCDGNAKVFTKKGVDSQYVIVKNGQDRNSTWGGWFVDGGNPAWQAKVFKEADRLFANGAQGLFLDTVDSASPWSSGAVCTAPGMLSLVEKLRARYPDKYIVANRGLFFLDPNAATYSPKYRQAVSGVMFEELYTSWKNERGVKSEWWSGNLAAAKYTATESAKPDGFDFMVLDYFAADQLGGDLMKAQMAEVKKLPGVVINSFNNAHLTAIYTTLLPAQGGF